MSKALVFVWRFRTLRNLLMHGVSTNRYSKRPQHEAEPAQPERRRVLQPELDGDAQPAPQACQEEGKKGSRGCEWPMLGLN